MREDAVLPFENIMVLVPGLLVVGVPVHAAPLQVSDLRDSFFSIAHLFV